MKLNHLLRNFLLLLSVFVTVMSHAADSKEDRSQWDNTFSLVARDPVTGAVGGAVSTARLAVGNRVLSAEFGVGAVASQANTNPMLAREALDHIRHGATAQEALDAALHGDDKHEERQVSIISATGSQTAFTGSGPEDFKGHIIGKNVVVAGNILVGRETLEAMVATFESSPGPLADRLMAALEAGQKAGGDRRGKVSAAILVLNEAPGTNSYSRNIDLRVDSSKNPVGDLRTLFDAYKAAFKIK